MPQTDLFSEVGAKVLRLLAKQETSKHVSGPLARDAMPRALARGPVYDNGEEMPPRGSEEPNGNGNGEDPNGGMTAEVCLGIVQQCMARLDPEQRDMLVEGLANMLQSEDAPASDGPLDNNTEALDRRRRTARDSRQAQDAAIAKRAAASASFASRWNGVVGNVSIDMARSRR